MKSFSPPSKNNTNRANSAPIQRVGQPAMSFLDNRPLAVKQRKLQEAANRNCQLVIQPKLPVGVIQLGKNEYGPIRETRQKTKDQRHNPFKLTHSRTLRNTKEQTKKRDCFEADRNNKLSAEEVERKNKQVEEKKVGQLPLTEGYNYALDGTRLWKGDKRPNGWGQILDANNNNVNWDDDFYRRIARQRVQNNRTEYWCEDGNGGGFYPRKVDRIRNEEFATIGHNVQWLNHINKKCDVNEYEVEAGVFVDAIAYEDVMEIYRDESNLELQTGKYNSTIAEPYKNQQFPGQTITRVEKQ